MSTNLKQFVTDIANAIRSKKGTSDPINPQDFVSEINTLSGKLPLLIHRTITKVSSEDLSGVQVIGDYAFAGCSDLTDITIPDNIQRIGNQAFRACSKLTYITIPASIQSIGAYALSIGSSQNMATIKLLSTTPPSIQSTTIDSLLTKKIVVPIGCGEVYKTATNWSRHADIIEEATV